MTGLFVADAAKPRSSLGGRIFLSLFCLVFLLMGLFFTGWIARGIWKNLTTYQWSTVSAVIVESRVESPLANDKDPVSHIRYRYNYLECNYTSDHYRPGDVSLETKGAYLLASRFAPGTETTCYVNPSESPQAVLRHKSRASPPASWQCARSAACVVRREKRRCRAAALK